MDEPKAEITVEEGAEKGRVVALRQGKTVEIGREGNFRLEDPSLSRRHCRIWNDGGGWCLEDAGSTWGTYVNGVRIKAHRLNSGDKVRVGNHVLVFTLEDIPSAAPAAPRAAATVPMPAPSAPPPPAEEAPPEPETAEAPDEFVPEGVCFNCGKPAPLSEHTQVADPLLGRTIANHLCERVLGAGGMGVVYRGAHVVMGRRAAIKTLRVLQDADPTMVKRLLREATAGGRIRHPNIVAVHDTGEQDSIAYVVMEYVVGGNLADVLDREKRLPVRRAVHLAAQVADALASAFKLGYIHRDIKPENILVTGRDVVKVTDFGLAKNLKEGELGGLTRTGQVLGTMLYMPPEQIVSSKGSDQRADIYSLGATLFHLLSGRPVFDSKSAITLLMDIRTKEPPMLSSLVPEVPAGVERIVARCLRKKPDERYQTPEELAADLRAARASLPA